MNDTDYMRIALTLASRAESENEVPVGAVLVSDGSVVGRGWNQPIGHCDPTAHAEIVAIRDTAIRQKNYRLPGSTLFVTVEPCAMCVGAMIHARIARLVYGADEPRTGAIHSAISLLSDPYHNHRIEVVGGVLQTECADKMRAFFAARR